MNTYMEKNGDVFSVDIRPAAGVLAVTLYLSFKDQLSYWEILKYKVVK